MNAFIADLRAGLVELCDRRSQIRFPSIRYQRDPASFARDVLGTEPWSRQIEILETIRDHDRSAIASGHKVSKSHSIAITALWWYCSWPDARVVLSSTTSRQVDQILWRELKMMRARSGRCIDCKAADPEGRHIPRPCPHSAIIEGNIGELARTGLKSHDFREIVGFTARESEAVAGVSGARLLYLIDEASGVPDSIFEAIEGNRAGGAKIALFSNPTKTSGAFFAAFHGKAGFYKTLRISSEETPNVTEGRVVIPGLATREWIEEKRREWGIDSALYKVRVKGEFATAEDGKVFSIHAIAEAEQRWHETPADGRLFVGIDPAGASGSGDETVFAIRRGYKVIELIAMRGQNDDAILAHAISFLERYRLPRETPVVVIDREGPIGASLYGLMRGHVDRNTNAFELVAVRVSDRAVRQPHIYDRMRDELTANLEAWIREGGAIPEDVKLASELHEIEWSVNTRGLLKTSAKDSLRKELGRSPDRYDAVALSAWEPLSMKDHVPVSALNAERDEHEERHSYDRTFDPYKGMR